MRLVLLLVLASGLAGCALSPGMGMSVPSSQVADSDVADTQVRIFAISAALIRKQLKELRDELPVELDDLPGPYRVMPRDVLSITVWDHPELTIPAGQYRSAQEAGHLVGEDGTLFYPYVGVVEVAGLTVAEIRELLITRLAKVIESPQLDVRVAAYRSQRIHVVGEVAKPGIYPITDLPLTIAEAVHQAGGLTATADGRNITLTRDGETHVVDLLSLYERGAASKHSWLRSGDVLYVPDRMNNKVFVMGEVRRPASLLMNRGRMSLAEALGDVGGVDPITSNAGRIYVIRGADDEPMVFHLDASNADAMLLADKFPLRPRDVVYVDAAGITRWNRVLSQIVPTIRGLRDGVLLDQDLR